MTYDKESFLMGLRTALALGRPTGIAGIDRTYLYKNGVARVYFSTPTSPTTAWDSAVPAVNEGTYYEMAQPECSDHREYHAGSIRHCGITSTTQFDFSPYTKIHQERASRPPQEKEESL